MLPPAVTVPVYSRLESTHTQLQVEKQLERHADSDVFQVEQLEVSAGEELKFQSTLASFTSNDGIVVTCQLSLQVQVLFKLAGSDSGRHSALVAAGSHTNETRLSHLAARARLRARHPRAATAVPVTGTPAMRPTARRGTGTRWQSQYCQCYIVADATSSMHQLEEIELEEPRVMVCILLCPSPSL